MMLRKCQRFDASCYFLSECFGGSAKQWALMHIFIYLFFLVSLAGRSCTNKSHNYDEEYKIKRRDEKDKRSASGTERNRIRIHIIIEVGVGGE